ncbi:ATP-binding cassette domain-containing protein [Streptodolium elevatio]
MTDTLGTPGDSGEPGKLGKPGSAGDAGTPRGTSGGNPGEARGAGAPVLSLRGVSKRYGAVQALSDVDLDVHPGEVVALVGDNGAGKSTLIKVIAGVGPPDGGRITWEGRQVAIPRPHEAQSLGIATVYQDLALCDNLDVVANLFLGRELRRGLLLDEVGMEKQATELLTTLSVKIPSVRIPVASLSGGQRQTVAISRSLLGEPKVVMLDEPTAALGVEQTAQVLDLIERLRERGLGVILISHNMDDVLAVADRIAVLRLGRNNGVFDVRTVTREELLAAITGATDNAVSRRQARKSGEQGGGQDGGEQGGGEQSGGAQDRGEQL